ncbi:MAG: permease-like cell division protein FtsX [Candidatus Shapirobacteria bacterium]
MSVTFLILTAFILVNSGLTSVLNHFESKPEITIFLKDGLDKTTLESTQNEIAAIADIREVRYISKEKALQLYKDLNKNNPLLTEMVTASILPASFEISAYNPKVLEVVAQKFTAKTDIVDEIVYQKDLIESLMGWTDMLRKVAIVTIVFFGLVAFFVTSVVIGLKITNRKDEINISRLLGASLFYVKRPFLLEGIIYGIFGSITGYLTTFLIFLYFKPKLNTFFAPAVFVSNDPTFYFIVFAFEVFVGFVVGLFTSFMVSKRYIKW